MIFQPLTAQDGPQLADLGAAMAFAPAPQVLGETLSAALAQGGTAFGALEEGTLAGALLLVRTAPDAARVTCGVRPSHERRGIGGLLLRMADDWAWENGVARLEIAVRKEDLVARHVFDRHGYGSAGFRRGVAGPDGQTFDELLLEKPVPPREEA